MFDWLLVSTVLVGLAMAWAIGAQDVSNALGTSVGSKALTVRQAIIVGGVFEFVGALMGGSVVTTISHGIIPQGVVSDSVYIEIMFCTLAGAFVWLAFATYFSLPVSTTHSLVGSLIGLALLLVPMENINTTTLKKIVMSWVTSPLLGCTISYSVFGLINTLILQAPNPLQEARRLIPYFFGGTIGVLSLFLFIKGPDIIRISSMSTCLLLATIIAIITAYVVNWRIQNENQTKVRKPKCEPPETKKVLISGTSDASHHNVNDDKSISIEISDKELPLDKGKLVEEAEKSFTTLMVITACVVAFAHGSNDVSNSIGPVAAVLESRSPSSFVTSTGEHTIPIGIMIAGGSGIVVGLATYGYKCMETVGEKITKLTFSRGFAAQIGTAGTVLSATLVGLSVSTTHCLIGSISGVALVESYKKINTQTLKKIIISWLVTMPASAFSSLIIFTIIRLL